MTEHLSFTDDTEVTFKNETFEKSRLKDLDLVTNIEHEDGEVVSCEIDTSQLTHVTLNYNAMEEQRYSWRRSHSDVSGAELKR